MRSLTLLTLTLAAFSLAACQDKPIEPMKPRVAITTLISAA